MVIIRTREHDINYNYYAGSEQDTGAICRISAAARQAALVGLQRRKDAAQAPAHDVGLGGGLDSVMPQTRQQQRPHSPTRRRRRRQQGKTERHNAPRELGSTILRLASFARAITRLLQESRLATIMASPASCSLLARLRACDRPQQRVASLQQQSAIAPPRLLAGLPMCCHRPAPSGSLPQPRRLAVTVQAVRGAAAAQAAAAAAAAAQQQTLVSQLFVASTLYALAVAALVSGVSLLGQAPFAAAAAGARGKAEQCQ